MGVSPVLRRNKGGNTMGVSKQRPSNSEGESQLNTRPEALLPDDDTSAAGEEKSSDEPSLDAIFGVLKNSRRRQVLRYLRENGSEATISDLAEHIAAAENGTTRNQLTSSQRKRVYVGLYQCHLQKMDEAGVVDYNQSRGHVELTDQADRFEEYLRSSADGGPANRWYWWYAGISALGLLSVVASVWFGLANSLVSLLLGSAVALALGCSLYYWQTEADGTPGERPRRLVPATNGPVHTRLEAAPPNSHNPRRCFLRQEAMFRRGRRRGRPGDRPSRSLVVGRRVPVRPARLFGVLHRLRPLVRLVVSEPRAEEIGVHPVGVAADEQHAEDDPRVDAEHP